MLSVELPVRAALKISNALLRHDPLSDSNSKLRSDDERHLGVASDPF
jgi:hypothetical protein